MIIPTAQPAPFQTYFYYEFKVYPVLYPVHFRVVIHDVTGRSISIGGRPAIVIASRIPPRHSEASRLRGFEALQNVERVLEEQERGAEEGMDGKKGRLRVTDPSERL